jgi:phosphopantothenoylcysteine decarboxylase / phosphopantothenate---cysteine ligase
MEAATLARAPGATIAIATAAVADWRPADTHAAKVKKTDDAPPLRLERNPDILAALGARKNGMFLVGFAAETDAHEANAREKLVRKHLDAIAVNDVSGERGFGPGDSSLVVLWGESGRRALPMASKRVLAGGLWDAIVAIRREARN